MKFSIGIPTCREGLNVPVNYAESADIVRMAQTAEQLGFYAVWGNDHLTIPVHLRETIPGIANFYEALIALSYIAAATEKLRLGTGVIVLPLREPVILAKQAATLDVFSNGRFLLGVGIGSIREEFAAFEHPYPSVHRGEMLEEGLEIISRLFTEDNVSFQGKYSRFKDIKLYPKPQQEPFPLYIAGNHPNIIERVVKWGYGWLIAAPSLEFVEKSVRNLWEAAEEAGRDPATIDVVAIQTLSIDQEHEKAVDALRNSRIARRYAKDKSGLSSMVESNLVGTPAEIEQKVEKLEKLGVTHVVAQNFASDSLSETMEQLEMFAEKVVAPIARSVRS